MIRVSRREFHRSVVYALAAILYLTGVPRLSAQPLPACYNTRAELYNLIFALQDSFPTRVKVDSIGHSRGDMLGIQYPIYAVKISDNVQVFEDEPVSLIICHIHAEEVVGLESSIVYMRLLTHRYQQYRDLVNNTQIYFIPTMNPDGLEVISLGQDNTWRKNGYHPPQFTGSCTPIPGVGEDSCGVDLNRNFDLNWIYGDTLWVRGAEEPFDYYRGPSPFSEPECRAVRDFALQIKPTTSVVLHSSRSGRVAERSIVAWQWGLDGAAKFSPDCTAIGRFNRRYLAQTHKWGGPTTGPYLEVWGGTHNGCLQDWFYWKIGTFQTLTETSPPINIQPDCAPLDTVISTLIPPLDWLNRRLINFDRDGDMSDQGAPLAIYTTDAQSGLPISAEWRILNTWTPLLPPRYTNEAFGRMTIIPPQGQITIQARKKGYWSDTDSTNIQPGGTTQSLALSLTPKPWFAMSYRVHDSANQAISSRLYLQSDFPEVVLMPSGLCDLQEPLDGYAYAAVPETGDYIGHWGHFYFDHDTTVDLTLPVGTVRWAENFESGLTNWTAGGTGGTWRLDPDTTLMGLGQSLCTNPVGYRVSYTGNADTWIAFNNAIDLTGGNVAHLEFYRRGRLEVPNDSLFVEISADGGASWELAAAYCDMEVPWTRTWVNLSPWTANTIRLRFRLKSDATLGDLGMRIDNLRILCGTDLESPPSTSRPVYEYKLTGAYPNPFNPSTTILYNVAAPLPVKLLIFNILGQQVRGFDLNPEVAGHHVLHWDGLNSGGMEAPSGLYFAQLRAPNSISTLKLLLLK
jgi:hypothetical protein